MRKMTALLTFFVALAGCHNNPKEARIQGEIKGLGNDTLYLYGIDRGYDRIDTIIAKEGKIDHTLKIDTLTVATLLFDQHTEVPLFLDKKVQIKIQGSVDALNTLTIEGTTENQELTEFQQSLKGLGTPSEKVIEERVEAFIRQHHSSLTSIYLLNKYFVQKTSPDFAKIKTLIELMTGTLQDNPLLDQVKEYAAIVEKVSVGKAAPFFSLPNAKGEKISRSIEKFKGKYLLIHFWASWNEESTEANAALRKVYNNHRKSTDFSMLGISLDIDKEIWKETIKRDTLNWEQVCDFTGLNSETVGHFALLNVPMNLLIAPTGTIVARSIQADSLTKKLKEVLKPIETKKKKTKQKTLNVRT